mgnify:FL=1|tara:strand:- start:467 stop:1441 length:975 start_codon:yes stop_codon:yes gene_type:complete
MTQIIEGSATAVAATNEPPENPLAGSILDMPVEAFSASLDRRGTNRKALMSWVADALVESVDYGAIMIGGRPSKKSLFKPGSEKICGMLGLRPTFPNLAQYEQAAINGKTIENLLIRCELVNGANLVVSEGVGARAVRQDNNDLNKSLKMALKSAMIDATLRCAGLSEVFTQDIEDMAPEAFGAPAGASKPLRQAKDLTAMPFGTHKGKPLADLPLDYMQWACGPGGLDAEDVVAALKAELANRSPDQDVPATIEEAFARSPDPKPAGQFIPVGQAVREMVNATSLDDMEQVWAKVSPDDQPKAQQFYVKRCAELAITNTGPNQ